MVVLNCRCVQQALPKSTSLQPVRSSRSSSSAKSACEAAGQSGNTRTGVGAGVGAGRRHRGDAVAGPQATLAAEAARSSSRGRPRCLTTSGSWVPVTRSPLGRIVSVSITFSGFISAGGEAGPAQPATQFVIVGWRVTPGSGGCDYGCEGPGGPPQVGEFGRGEGRASAGGTGHPRRHYRVGFPLFWAVRSVSLLWEPPTPALPPTSVQDMALPMQVVQRHQRLAGEVPHDG